jgi:hypothetical protein
METDSEPLQEVDFWQLQDEIQARRDALGITEADDDECRNSGLRRTEKKRAILRFIAERCAAAGVEPLAANY